MFFCGMLTITRSASTAASFAQTAVAPVSAARSASVSGAREFETRTVVTLLGEQPRQRAADLPRSDDPDLHLRLQSSFCVRAER